MNPLARTAAPSVSDSLFRRALLRKLAHLTRGTLELVEGGERSTFGSFEPGEPSARLSVHSPAFYRRVALGGTLGAAESYVDGDFTTDDLTSLVRLVLRNEGLTGALESGASRLGALGARLFTAFRPNTRAGSRRNIASHYDLGNDFFERLLDPTLCYSSGVFPSESATLEEASLHKLTLLCEELELRPGDELVEIGTGWGSLALHAAERYGAKVVTTTISTEQHRYAKARVEQRGLSDRVSVLDVDYRDLEGSFDKLVSVEMVEAIGEKQYPAFFERCGALLKPGGRMVLQSITITERAYDRHLAETDFIKRYVFPGSSIPSVTALVTNAARAGGLELRSSRDYGQHYARTLAEWRRNAERHQGWIIARYGAAFYRQWMFYLGYCEAGFREGYLGVIQAVFEKPEWRTS